MEMMIAILVSTMVLGSATTLLGGLAQLNGKTDREVVAQERARTAIDALAAQLRNATGPTGSSPMYYPPAGSTAATTELVFYAPVASANTTNNPRGLQWVRYCLDYTNTASEVLWMQTAPYNSTQAGPPSTSTCPNAAWPKQQAVATSVVNRASSPVTALFTPGPDSSGVIRDLQVRLLVKGDVKRTPTPITSSIHFRNAKTGPSAVVSCQAQNGHAVCDASKSTDPDGEALSYKWKYRCCSPGFSGGDTNWEAGQTSYLFDKGGLSPPANNTYAIDVQVTDTSGLSTVATAQVTVP
jgi:Tfp pilus assembly protein PilW